jgi:hypothetical protein
MKKIIIILSIVLTLALAGVLYGTHEETDERESVSTDSVATNYFPDPMPDVIIDPMIWVPLY